MTDEEIFKELLTIARQAKSQRGAVAACLVRGGRVLVSSASSDVPNRHAEDLLFEKITHQNMRIDPNDILYVTIQPCGERTPGGGGEMYGDCATKIINSPVKHVIYAVPDPHYSSEVDARFEKAGISSHQINNAEITKNARAIFNETLSDAKYINQKGNRAFL